MFRNSIDLLRKDLLLEVRGRESVPAMVLLALSTLVVLHFALGQTSLDGELASGALWVTILFSATLGIGRLFVSESEDGGMDAVLLSPVDRTAILVAKVCALFTFLVAVQIVIVPAFALLLLGPHLAPALPKLAGILLLTDFAIATVGSLVGAIAVQSRIRDLLAPLLALPLLIPPLIAATHATAGILASGGPAGVPGRWPLIIALYALVFGLLGIALYDNVLDD
ncbi:MAG: heme exporter protein CcmB [Solirubrobacterales bacterium]|nr:heme exporter protein CcmB [Solirubrobacterales bacterium]